MLKTKTSMSLRSMCNNHGHFHNWSCHFTASKIICNVCKTNDQTYGILKKNVVYARWYSHILLLARGCDAPANCPARSPDMTPIN